MCINSAVVPGMRSSDLCVFLSEGVDFENLLLKSFGTPFLFSLQLTFAASL